MIRALILPFLLLCAAPLANAQASVEEPLDRVLGAVVGEDGRVDYERLRRQHAGDLTCAVDALARVDPSTLRSDAQKTAFLVNAYNAHVLRLVLQHDARHLERQGLFDAFFQAPVAVAGRRMTLNQLEHGLLRRQDRVDGAPTPRALRALRPRHVDPRIHAAINCAAVSCPPLQRRAFRAATLDRDLDRAFRAFVASPRAARLDGRRLVLSSLFDWFAEDFEAGGRPLGDAMLGAMSDRRPDAAALRRRLAGKTAADLRRDRSVRFAYDWTVNRR